MASIRYSISPGQSLEQVVSAAGLATVSALVEITFDQGASAITDASLAAGARPMKKSEIQQCMRTLEQYLINDQTVS